MSEPIDTFQQLEKTESNLAKDIAFDLNQIKAQIADVSVGDDWPAFRQKIAGLQDAVSVLGNAVHIHFEHKRRVDAEKQVAEMIRHGFDFEQIIIGKIVYSICDGKIMNSEDDIGTVLHIDDRANRDDGLRLREHEAKLSNQQIVEFAYLTKEMIELCIGTNDKRSAKLSFEEANCYLACFYKAREMLGLIDSEYIEFHGGLVEFYQEGRELSNDWDRLHWIVPNEAPISEPAF